jgi:hypothetical protein
MQILGYPLEMTDRIPEITEARNVELGLGLQVAMMPLILLYLFSYLLGLGIRYLWILQCISEQEMTMFLLLSHFGIQYVNNMALKLFVRSTDFIKDAV